MSKNINNIMEEQNLFKRYVMFIKTFWLYLVIILSCSFTSMFLMQIMIRAAYLNKILIIVLCLIIVLTLTGICIWLLIKVIRRAQLKNIFEGDVCFLVYFSLLFVSCVLFMVLFLMLDHFSPNLWFLKSTFFGIALMVVHWSIVAVLLLPNKLSRYISTIIK